MALDGQNNRRNRLVVLLGSSLLATFSDTALSPSAVAQTAAQAGAQTAPQTSPQASAGSSPQSNEPVVVTAQRSNTATSIDRRIYRVGVELQSASGTAADILNTVPSVSVDPEGQVSLRGDPNVTVLIDGRSSTQLTGAAAGDGLGQIQASDIERIEVMTNPPAEYSANGTGGVINIVTRRSRRRAASATLRANAGVGDRYLVGVQGSRSASPWRLSGGASLKQDRRLREIDDQRSLDDPIVGLSRGRHTQVEQVRRIIANAQAGVEYALHPGESASASASATRRTGDRGFVQDDTSTDPGGAPLTSSTRTSVGHELRWDDSAALHYERMRSETAAGLSLALQRTGTSEREHYDYVNVHMLPPAADSRDRLLLGLDLVSTEFSGEYVAPGRGASVLKAGYDIEIDRNSFDNGGGSIDPITGVVIADPQLNNHFRYDQSIYAAYASYERTIGRTDVLAGLRVEQTDINTRQITGGIEGGQNYLRAYPNLHVSYDLTDTLRLLTSYSRRIERPDPEDLNPFPDHQDTRNLRAGNPNLKPRETESFELGFSDRQGEHVYELTGFYRINRNATTDITEPLGNDVLLTTKTNLPLSRSGGVEFSLHDRLARALSYDLNGNVFYTEFDATPLGGVGVKSGVSATARASLDYRPDASDVLQVSANYTGERLTPQGSISPTIIVNVGYRHQFGAGLAAVLTAADLFDQQTIRRRLQTPDFSQVYERHFAGRVVWLALTYSWGGQDRERSAFDYDQ